MSTRSLKRAGMDLGKLQQVASSSPMLLSVENADAQGNTKNGDVFHWRMDVRPPAASLYAGATYTLLFTLSPEQYPFKPPIVRVLTPIFNPMVSDVGNVCEALLQNDEWKPTTPAPEFVEKVIQAIFVDFKKYDILNEAAAELMVNGTSEDFKKQADKVRATSKT